MKETLRVAPGAASVTVVAVRHRDGTEDGIEALFAGRLERQRWPRRRSPLAQAPFATQDAWPLLCETATDQRVRTTGVTRALQPLDLAGEPALAELVGVFDTTKRAEPVSVPAPPQRGWWRCRQGARRAPARGWP